MKLIPQQLGIQIGENFMPPSVFAEAYIGYMNGQEVFEAFAEAKKEDLHDTPLLQLTDYDTLEKYVFRSKDSLNLLRQKATDDSHSLSLRLQSGMVVKSRSDRRKSNDYNVTLDGCVCSIEDIMNLKVRGGSPHSLNNSKRNIHWNEQKKYEKRHIDEMNFDENFTLIDYHIACTLFTVEKELHEGTLRSREQIPDDHIVPNPYRFEKHPKYAFESLLRRYAPLRMLKEHGIENKDLLQIDKYLIGKPIVKKEFKPLLLEGPIYKNVIVKQKDFGYKNGKWAILQALEKHQVEKGRTFSGYAVEYPHTEFETYSVVFDGKDHSVRIMFGDNIEAPVCKYMAFKPRKWFDKRNKPYRVWFTDKENPADRINLGKDIQKRKTIVGREQDWRTGQDSQVTIFEPLKKNYHSALHILQENDIFMREYDLRSHYITL